MMQFAISTEDFANIRFAISPMITTVLSARSMFYPEYLSPMRDWLETLEQNTRDMDFPALRRFQPHGHYSVDFLLPFPEKSRPKFEDQLQQIATTPLAAIENDLEYLIRNGVLTVDDLSQFKNLASLHAQTVDELACLWEIAIQPYWDSIQSVLEGDLMHHSREYMVGGANTMFAGLDSYIWLDSPDLLSICTKAQTFAPIDPKGQGIVLVPNIVSNCGVWVQTLDDKPPVISYRAYGAGLWKNKNVYEPAEAMNILFGENRSRLLYALAAPTSTKDLAIKLELTPGAISQQLGQLKQAGLVDANRAGRAVYYRLNQRGEQLLDLLGTA